MALEFTPRTLDLSGVTHRYVAEDAVVQDISITFSAGEIVALMGPSGSGKSTLLSIVGLLMRPTEGTIKVVNDIAWSSSREARRLRRESFSWIFQNSASHAARTALENVCLPLLAAGLSFPEAERNAGIALTRVGLGHRIDAKARTLSGGELQRVTVARALASESPFILADEPTGQLDRMNTELVCTALRECAKSGAGVIVATHDATVADICDRTILLRDGMMVRA